MKKQIKSKQIAISFRLFVTVQHFNKRRKKNTARQVLEYGTKTDARIWLRLLIYFLFGGVFLNSISVVVVVCRVFRALSMFHKTFPEL